MPKPPFDPNRPYQLNAGGKPPFNPQKGYTVEPPAPAEAETIQEMHPSFSTGDRLLTKTFGNDAQASANYLQERHPGLQVKVDEGGQIVAKGKAEKDWRVLDPDTGPFSSDILGDLGDIAGDIGTGAVTTGATALGALGGAPLGAAAGTFLAGPPGTLAGAGAGALAGGAAGGAASAAGLEALRQLVGKGIGVNEEVSGGDIALQGGLGALSPLLFGTGATASQIAAKTAGKGISTFANPFLGAKEGVKNLGKSALRTGASKVPFVGEELAAKVPQNAASSMKALLSQYGGDESMEKTAEALLRAQSGIPVQTFRGMAGKVLPKLGETTSGIQADVIKTYAADPEGIENLTEGGVRNYLEQTTDDNLGILVERKDVIGELMNTARSTADDVAAHFDETAGPEVGNTFRVDMTRVRQPMIDLLEKANKDALKHRTPIFTEEADALDKLYERYFVSVSSEMTPETLADDAFGEPQVIKSLSGHLNASDAFDMKDRLLKLAKFGDNSGNQTSHQQAVSRAAQKAVHEIDKELNRATLAAARAGESLGGAKVDPDFSYRFAQDEYSMLKDSTEDLEQLLRNPRVAHSALSNLGNKSRITDMEGVAAIDAKYGTNLVQAAKRLSAHKNFSDAPWLAKSGGGTTSTSRTVPLSDSMGSLGYLLGAKSGLGQGGAGVGTAIGTAMGSVVGGPAAIKRYLRWNKAMGDGKGLMRDAGMAPPRFIAPWMLMSEQEE